MRFLIIISKPLRNFMVVPNSRFLNLGSLFMVQVLRTKKKFMLVRYSLQVILTFELLECHDRDTQLLSLSDLASLVFRIPSNHDEGVCAHS